MSKVSALQFESCGESKGEGLFAARNCMDYSCNRAGRHKLYIYGVACLDANGDQERLCTQHMNEWIRSWGAARDAKVSVAA